jgi:hypothetical protein
MLFGTYAHVIEELRGLERRTQRTKFGRLGQHAIRVRLSSNVAHRFRGRCLERGLEALRTVFAGISSMGGDGIEPPTSCL